MKSIPYIALFMLMTMLAACSSDLPTTPVQATDPAGLTDKSRGRPGMPMGQFIHANKEALGRQTFRGATMLERAAWLYRDDNDGRFPSYAFAPNEAGMTLVDYLPGGNRLWNPFVGVRSNPVEGAASTEGEIGYMSIVDEQGYIVGYTITAQGVHDPLQYLVLEYDPRGTGMIDASGADGPIHTIPGPGYGHGSADSKGRS